MTQIDALDHLNDAVDDVLASNADAEGWVSTARVARYCNGDEKEVSRALLAAVRSRRAERRWFRLRGRGAARYGYRPTGRGIDYLIYHGRVEAASEHSHSGDADESNRAEERPEEPVLYPVALELPDWLPEDPVALAFPKMDWAGYDVVDLLASFGGVEDDDGLESLPNYWSVGLRVEDPGVQLTKTELTAPDGRPVVVLDDSGLDE